MNYKYFVGVASISEVKTKFRELAKVHHPDKGGKEDDFKAMVAEYEYINSKGAFIDFPIKTGSSSPFTTEDIDDFFRTTGFKWHTKGGGNPFNSGSTSDSARAQAEYFRQQQQENAKRQAYEEAERIAKHQREMREKQAKKAEYERKQEEARRKAKYHYSDKPWEVDMELDMNYRLITNIIIQADKDFRTVKWMLMEIYKIDGLGINHFKYIRYYIKELSAQRANLVEQWVSDSYKNYVTIQSMEWRLQ